MKVTSTKLDKPTHDRLLAKCDGQGCSVSQYVKSLILRDLGEQNSSTNYNPQPKPMVNTSPREQKSESIPKARIVIVEPMQPKIQPVIVHEPAPQKSWLDVSVDEITSPHVNHTPKQASYQQSQCQNQCTGPDYCNSENRCSSVDQHQTQCTGQKCCSLHTCS